MSTEANLMFSDTTNNAKICDDTVCPSVKKYININVENKDEEKIGFNENDNIRKPSYQNRAHTGNDVVGGLAELNEILENLTTLCRSPKCYNAYMGYTGMNYASAGTKTSNLIPEMDANIDYMVGGGPCGSAECSYKNDKQIRTVSSCKKIMCPFASSKYFNRNVGRVTFDTSKKGGVNIPCNSEECPYTSQVNNENRKDEKTGVKSAVEPCGGDTCPYTKGNNYQPRGDFTFTPLSTNFLESNNIVEPCGGETCPFKPGHTNIKGSKVRPGSNFLDKYETPIINTYKNLSYSRPAQMSPPTYGSCGQPTCSSISTDLNDPVGLCGRNSCPYAFVKTRNDTAPSNYIDNQCPYKCGNKESPPVCPYAPANNLNNAYGTCNTSCPYATKTNNTYNYEDYGFIQEASRPYSGLTCPYAMRSSQNPNLQNFDRNLYKRIYGEETAEIIDPRKKTMDACDDSTCSNKRPEFDSGLDICGAGAPKGYTCDKPDVEPCLSPDCKMTKLRKEYNNESTICGDAPADYTCDKPDVEPCGSPDCKMKKKKEECTIKTCPVFKVISFCTGCGGIIIANNKNIKNKINSVQLMMQGDSKSSNLTNNSVSILSKEEQKHNRSSEEIDENKSRRMQKLSKETSSNDKRRNSINNNEESRKKKTKKTEQSKVPYGYPGVEVGHKDCAIPGLHVPTNMGWLWNLKPPGNIKLWKGYKPGAVPKTVHKMMVQHRRDLGIIDPMDYSTRKKRSKSSTKLRLDEPKHAVLLRKANGMYTITMNPVKDPKIVPTSESPFIDCTPVQFKIEKKPISKDKRFAICPCDKISATATQTQSISNGELEFHFSPPAAIPDVKPKKKKVMTSIETQYNPADVVSSPAQNKKKGGGKKKEGKGKKKGKKNLII